MSMAPTSIRSTPYPPPTAHQTGAGRPARHSSSAATPPMPKRHDEGESDESGVRRRRPAHRQTARWRGTEGPATKGDASGTEAPRQGARVHLSGEICSPPATGGDEGSGRHVRGCPV